MGEHTKQLTHRCQLIPKCSWKFSPKLKFIIHLKRDTYDPTKWKIKSYARERLLIKLKKVSTVEKQQKKRTYSEAFSNVFEDVFSNENVSVIHDIIPTSSIHKESEKESLEKKLAPADTSTSFHMTEKAF